MKNILRPSRLGQFALGVYKKVERSLGWFSPENIRARRLRQELIVSNLGETKNRTKTERAHLPKEKH